MSTSVKEAIAARHSVRAFARQPLSKDEIRELLEAARNAPSSLNSQPWRFRVVTDPEDLAWFGTSEASRKQTWLAQAGAIFICCADLEHYVKDSQSAAFFFRSNSILQGEPLKGVEAYVQGVANDDEAAKFGACAMNVGLAVAFMMLRAVELGLGTCWVGMFNEANVKARFGLPAGHRVVNLLAVGRSDGSKASPRVRKSLEEIVIPG
jgi:nitroreductase